MTDFIPYGWKKVSVQDIATVLRGSSPRPKSDSRYYGGLVPRLMVADISRDGKYVTPKIDSLTEDGAKLSRPVPKGTLTIVCSGVTAGDSSILAIDACIHDGLLALAGCSLDVDVEFLYYTFQLRKQQLFNNATHGGAYSNLTTQILREFSFPVPSIFEQRKIAERLSVWDEAITKTESLIAALRERKKGLMQRLLTGQVRFAGFGGDWHETELSEFFYSYSKKNSANEDLTILSCSTVHGIVQQSVIFDKRIASEDIRRYKVVERGDLIFDPMLLWDASIGFLEVVDRGVISPAYTTLKFKKNSCNQLYFKYLLKTHYYRQHYKFISQGTNVRRKKAPVEAFLKLPVWLPATIEEQNKIVAVLQESDKEIDLHVKKLEALKQQKKGLMQRLLTGEIRVRV